MVFTHGWVVFTPGVFLLKVGWKALVFWHFSLSFCRLLTFPFILAFVYYPSSTCRVNLSRTDTCPINLYPKSLGVVVKAKECDSVRCRALNGSEDCFPWIFWDLLSRSVFYRFCPSFRWDFSSTEVWTVLGCIPSLSYVWCLLSLGHNPPRLGPPCSPRVNGPGSWIIGPHSVFFED